MMENIRFILIVVATLLLTIVCGQKCNVVPRCTCDFDGEEVEVEEQTPMRNEALAGAVGALGSLVVSGGGFGIWYLLKARGSGSDLLDRSDSALSEDSLERGKKGKYPPPSYHSKCAPQPRAPNIYRAGMKDHLTHKVGRTGLQAF